MCELASVQSNDLALLHIWPRMFALGMLVHADGVFHRTSEPCSKTFFKVT